MKPQECVLPKCVDKHHIAREKQNVVFYLFAQNYNQSYD